MCVCVCVRACACALARALLLQPIIILLFFNTDFFLFFNTHEIGCPGCAPPSQPKRGSCSCGEYNWKECLIPGSPASGTMGGNLHVDAKLSTAFLLAQVISSEICVQGEHKFWTSRVESHKNHIWNPEI